MPSLLITSVGSGVGHNPLDGLEGRRQGLRVIGSNSEASAAANFRCDRFYLAPPAADAAAWDAFHEALMAREAIDLAIPARDEADHRGLRTLRRGLAGPPAAGVWPPVRP